MTYQLTKRNRYYDPPDYDPPDYDPTDDYEYPYSARNFYQDFEEFHLPLARLHHANLHGFGVVHGLDVSGAIGGAEIAVHAGVAVDPNGRMIILSEAGKGDVGLDPPNKRHSEKLVPVPLSTAEYAGQTLYVTIQFSEILRTTEGSGGRWEQVPWIRLQPVSEVDAVYGAGEEKRAEFIILAVADIGQDGALRSLSHVAGCHLRRRMLSEQTVEELWFQRSGVGADGTVQAMPPSKLLAGEASSLRIETTQLDLAGNVGIGKSAVPATLTVSGPTNLNDTLHVAHAVTLDQGLAVDGNVTIGKQNPFGPVTGTLTVKSATTLEGNVRIGTLTTTSKLNVRGDTTITGNLAIAEAGAIHWGSNSVLRSDQGGSIELGGYKSPGQGTPYIDFHYLGLTQDYNTRIINDADGRLTIDANQLYVSGSVGIGTNSPKNKLGVVGSAVIGSTYALGSSAPPDGLLVEGNVGIGTTMPRTQFEVTEAIAASRVIEIDGYTDPAKGVTPTITSGVLWGGGPTFRDHANCWRTSEFPSSMEINLGAVFQQLHYVAFGTLWRTDRSVIPKAYSIDISGSEDKSSWTRLVTVTDNTNSRVIHALNTGPARWVRLNVEAPQPGQIFVHISGFQVLVNDGGALAGRDPWAIGPDGHATLATIRNVGIGTANPQAKLQVSGGAIMPSVGKDENAGIIFPKNPGGGASDAAWIRYYSRGGESTTFEIGTSNDADDHIAFMSSGNVGIGTVNPSAKLEVVGDLKVTSKLSATTSAYLATADGKVGIGTTDPKNKLDVKGATVIGAAYASSNTAPANGLLVEGNVGIGATSPATNLHVGKSEATAGTVGAIDRLAIQPYGHTGGPWRITARDDSSNAYLDLRYGTAHLLTVIHTGNVGIGTANPQAKLQVSGGAIMPSVGKDENAGIIFPKNPGGGASDAAWIRYYSRGGESTTFEIGTSNDADDHIAFMSSGNVGIGTYDPKAKLHIVHTPQNADGGALILGPTNEANLRFGYDTNYSWIQSHMSKPLAINPIGNNVGIGTVAPSAKLSVVASGATEIVGTAQSSTFRTSAGNLGAAQGNELSLASIGFHSSLNGHNISLGVRAYRAAPGEDWTTAAIGLGIDVDDTVRVNETSLWLHPYGNVGIGVTDPKHKLDVAGWIVMRVGAYNDLARDLLDTLPTSTLIIGGTSSNAQGDARLYFYWKDEFNDKWYLALAPTARLE